MTDRWAPNRAAQPRLRALAGAIMRDAREGTPVRTGTLRAGWHIRASPKGNVIRVRNPVHYAMMVEYGHAHAAPRAMLGKAVARNRGRS